MHLRSFYCLLLVLYGLQGLACSDSEPYAANEAGTMAGTTAGVTAGTSENYGGLPAGTTAGVNMVNSQDVLVLQIEGQRQSFVGTTMNVDLKVRYILNNVQPMSDTRITFELYNDQRMLSPQGVGGSNLSAQTSITDGTGTATVTFYGGSQSTVVYVKAYDATRPNVTPVEWALTIGNADEGGLAVTVRYNTSMIDGRSPRYTYTQFDSAYITLFNDGRTCAQLKAEAPSFRAAYLGPLEIRPFNDVDNQISVPALPNGTRFNVIAMIYNRMGVPVTVGCYEGAMVQAGQSNNVEVITDDIPLVFKGIYTALNRFDLIEAMQNSGEGSLATIGDIFNVLRVLGGSGETLGQEVISLICDFADVSGTACDIVGGIAGGAVGNILNNSLPENIKNVLTITADILNIVGDLTIVGEIDFVNAPDENGIIINNRNRWRKLRFDWQGSEIEATFGQLGSFSADVQGTFDAKNQGTHVDILEHNFAISYGSIILGLMEAWIIPLALGESSGLPIPLEQLLRNYIPCDRINESVGLPMDSMICDTVLVTAVSTILRNQISTLDFPEGAVKLSGRFVPVDLDNNLSVEKLDQGQWFGIINDRINFDGCFTACQGMICNEPPCQIIQGIP
jgi:hypothetical protein